MREINDLDSNRLLLIVNDQRKHSPFAKLLPKVAADLRAHGWTDVETGLIPGGVHYLVEDQPNALAELIEKRGQRQKDRNELLMPR